MTEEKINTDAEETKEQVQPEPDVTVTDMVEVRTQARLAFNRLNDTREEINSQFKPTLDNLNNVPIDNVDESMVEAFEETVQEVEQLLRVTGGLN